ncbi:MAG TPA: hypothetical protein VGE93_11340 [Bryobacteraceae bacterium]
MSKPIVVDMKGTRIDSDILVVREYIIRSFPQKFYEPLKWLSSGG